MARGELREVVHRRTADARGLPEEAFCGRSRAHGGCVRSPGPKRKTPVAGLFASFSKCDHSRSLCSKRGAGLEQQDVETACGELLGHHRPAAARTDDDHVTHWIGRLPALPVALELLAPVRDPA